jgi:hypothetical protein
MLFPYISAAVAPLVIKYGLTTSTFAQTLNALYTNVPHGPVAWG